MGNLSFNHWQHIRKYDLPALFSLFSLISISLRWHKIEKAAFRCFSSIQKDFIFVSAVGADRRGIVSDITKIVVEKGGNVGESQATNLGSHFGLSMLVSAPKHESEALQASLTSLPGLATSCFVTGDPNDVSIIPDIGCKFYYFISCTLNYIL